MAIVLVLLSLFEISYKAIIISMHCFLWRESCNYGIDFTYAV